MKYVLQTKTRVVEISDFHEPISSGLSNYAIELGHRVLDHCDIVEAERIT